MKKEISEKVLFPKNFFLGNNFFPPEIPPFIVFGDLKLHFSIVWLSFCLLTPFRAIVWSCFAAAWLVAGNLQLERGVSMARVGALHTYFIA